MNLVPEDDLPDTLRSTKPSMSVVPEDDLPDTAKALAATKTPTVSDIRKEDEAARQKLRKAGYEASTMKPVTGEGGAAFGVFRQQDKAVRAQNIEQAKKDVTPKITAEEIANNDQYFQIANNFLKARGEPTFDPTKETKQDLVERFYSKRRFAEFNTVLGMLPELASLMNSDKETATNIALGRRLYDQAESALGSKTLSGGRLALDIVRSIISDAANYVGFGAGKLAATGTVRKGVAEATERLLTSRTAAEGAELAAKEAAKTPAEKAIAEKVAGEAKTAAAERFAADKAKLATTARRREIGTSVGVEGVVGGAADIYYQRAEDQTIKLLSKAEDEYPDFLEPESPLRTTEAERLKVEEGVDWGRVLGTSVLTAGISGAASLATKPITIKDKGSFIDSKIKEISAKNPTDPITPVEAEVASVVAKNIEPVNADLVKQHGRAILERLDPAGVITDSKIREQYSTSATRLVMQLMKDDPANFFQGQNELISDSIYRIFKDIDQVDDVALEAAMKKAGVSPEEFAAADRASTGDAGRRLQSLSVAARLVNKVRQYDPSFDRRMKDIYGVNNDQPTALAEGANAIRRLERESKAWITSGIDTLARNVIGNNVGLTMKASVDMMEGFVYSVGKGVRAASGEKTKVFSESMGESLKDALRTFYYMKNNGLAEDVTERVLQNNPVLLRQITNTTQETDLNDISRVGRWAQSLNSAVDGFQRRAIFAASVEQQVKERLGADLYKDILAKNKEIPTTILKEAMDDAFKGTLSYTPRQAIKSFSAFEDSFERVGNTFVRVSQAPGMSLAIPFPRFVTNAIAFQYNYSPVGLVGAGEYFNAATKLRKSADTLTGEEKAMRLREADRVMEQGLEKGFKASVGVGMLAAATMYREENLDKPWSQVGNYDVKAIFPLAPYLIIGDYIARSAKGLPGNPDFRNMFQTLVGFKAPAGTQLTIFESAPQLFESEEKFKDGVVALGKLVGDFAGRFTQPFVVKQMYDLFDLWRGDEALKARDPNVLSSESTAGKGVEAAAQRVAARLPVAKEQLEPAIVRFKEEEVQTPSKEGEFFNRLVGIRPIAQPSQAEKELVTHSVDLYKVYPPPTGDKEYDRLFIENVNKTAMTKVNNVINNYDEYKKGTSEEKKNLLTSAIQSAVKDARADTDGYFAESKPDQFNRIQYLTLSSEQKKIVNQRYARDHGGRTMEEDKAYNKINEYSQFGNLEYEGESLKAQTDRLLNRK